MTRLTLAIIILAALAVPVAAMDGFGSSDDKFPEPDMDFGATVTDTEGVVHVARKVSFRGETALLGYRGKASVKIDFNRINRITFKKTNDKAFVNAVLVLRSGKKVDLKVKGLARCYGITELGEMSVRARDLRTIVFDQGPPKEIEDDK